MEKKLFEILVCPLCKGKLKYDKKNNSLLCYFDKLSFPIQDGIPRLIEKEAAKMNEGHE